MNAFCRLIFAGLLLGTAHSVALADSCKDVLVNGTKATQEWKNDTYLNIVLAAESSEDTASNSSSTRRGTTGAKLFDFGFNQNFTAQDAQNFHRAARSSLNYSRILQDKSSVLLASGDKAIVKAWGDCMLERGGLSAVFRPINATEANLDLEWYSYPVAAGAKHTSSIARDSVPNLKGVTIVSGRECLTKGFVFEPRHRCTVQFRFDSAWNDLGIVVKSEHGDVSAYLPPRLRLKSNKQSYPRKGVDTDAPPTAINTSKWPMAASSQCVSVPPPWVFMEGTLDLQLSRVVLAEDQCVKDIKLSGGNRVCYLVSIVKLDGSIHDYTCRGQLLAEIENWEWVPDEHPVPK